MSERLGTTTTHSADADEYHDDIIYPARIPFLLVHLVCFAAIWTGVTLEAVVIGAVLYVGRMFVVTAGYHRYFSHRSFRTSRLGQYVLALAAQSSAQRGILWWAGKHRHHHLHSDSVLDIHSPKQRGFWYAHVGWIFAPGQCETSLDAVPDLARYPELVRLDRHPYVPATILGVLVWLIAGWPGLIVGFFWSTVLLYHGSFAINSLAHVHGNQRYVTGDDSRNNWWLALITLGEGWHNNHHAYQSSTRQGFRWWEIDITYYGLRLLSWVGVVSHLIQPPRALVRNETKLGRRVVEKVARQLAGTLAVDGISARVREAWANTPTLAELRERAERARSDAVAMLQDMHLPEIPTLDDIRARAHEMFSATPSMEEIVARTRELLLEALTTELLLPEPASA